MKSKTSFFNATVLKKDILRFAPAWGIYFVGGMIVMLMTMIGNVPHSLASSLGNSLTLFSTINLIYAAVVAQLLFGDLFNTRLCNALHAFPMRREEWFITHVVSGLLFSVVPHVVAMFFVIPSLGEFWFAALWWILGMALQYIFYFGVAVLSCFCVGNRFAMVVVYAMINFATAVIGWFCTAVYEPLMYGVRINMDNFLEYCPAVQFTAKDYLLFDWSEDNIRIFEGVGDGFGYAAVAAVVGVALLAGALLLYRKRRLETAGDAIALKPLYPVFTVTAALFVGAFLALIGDGYSHNLYFFLAIGIVIGWFCSQMLLQRTVRIFMKKVFAGLGILLLVMTLTVTGAYFDLFGISRWSPAPETVESISVNGMVEITDPEHIATLLEAQEELALRQQDDVYGSTVEFEIRMKGGHVATRSYSVDISKKVAVNIRKVLLDPVVVFGTADKEQLLSQITEINVLGYTLKTPQQLREMVDALYLDNAGSKACAGAGAFMYNYESGGWYSVRIELKDGSFKFIYVSNYADNVNKFRAEYGYKQNTDIIDR